MNNKLAVIFSSVAILLSIFAFKSDSAKLGGTFNPATVDFAGGIKTTTIQASQPGAATPTLIAGSTSAGLFSYGPVLTYTTDTTLTTDQSGATINMGTAGLDMTLPSPTDATGVRYRFVVSAAFATTDMTIIAGTADTIEGSLIVAGAVVACTAADIITIAAANEDVGDFIDLFSNGTNWIIGANQAMTASNHACSG